MVRRKKDIYTLLKVLCGLKSTEFGDDKDRVLIKSDGEMTYITPDIAYHKDKYDRGISQLINLWGPDHHGYIPRLKSSYKRFRSFSG